jgi:hypothetical protein
MYQIWRIDGLVRPEILAGQDGQNDQRQHGELQDGVDILGGGAFAELAQFRLEIEQHGRRDGQHDGQRRVAEPDGRAQRVGNDDGRL